MRIKCGKGRLGGDATSLVLSCLLFAVTVVVWILTVGHMIPKYGAEVQDTDVHLNVVGLHRVFKVTRLYTITKNVGVSGVGRRWGELWAFRKKRTDQRGSLRTGSSELGRKGGVLQARKLYHGRGRAPQGHATAVRGKGRAEWWPLDLAKQTSLLNLSKWFHGALYWQSLFCLSLFPS